MVRASCHQSLFEIRSRTVPIFLQAHGTFISFNYIRLLFESLKNSSYDRRVSVNNLLIEMKYIIGILNTLDLDLKGDGSLESIIEEYLKQITEGLSMGQK